MNLKNHPPPSLEALRLGIACSWLASRGITDVPISAAVPIAISLGWPGDIEAIDAFRLVWQTLHNSASEWTCVHGHTRAFGCPDCR